MPKSHHVAVYYFPQYHVDPQNEARHGPNWTEWELLKCARPRFSGHRQPKVPLWGYLDESQPEVAEQKIAVAADHGIDSFIFDWYWYDGVPFLHRALENGFMKATNNHRLKFSLMWANHDWIDIFPLKRSTRTEPKVVYRGAVSRADFDRMTDYIISTYFGHPSYWKIDGCPYFSIYCAEILVQGLGSLSAAQEALLDFRRKTEKAGFPGLHLNAVLFGLVPPKNEKLSKEQFAKALGFSSVTSYVWVHDAPLRSFPTVSYADVAAQVYERWEQCARTYSVPYIPNVTMGWDSSPRTCQSDVFEHLGYPFTPVIVDNTPAAFQAALENAKQHVDQVDSKGLKVVTINAWNEWTEGSYLEPDTYSKFDYLRAVRNVFAAT